MSTEPYYRALILVAAMWITSAALSSPAVAATYLNDRYGYSINYPADLLIPEREADNGDGRKFHAPQGTATMAVWANGGGADESPEEIARRYEGDCGHGRPAYKVVKSQLVALSCLTPKGRVVYFKTVIHGDWITTVMFDYPYSERTTWDRVVERVSGSLVGTTDATWAK